MAATVPLLTFIIPIRHPENVRDTNEQRRTLEATIRSIAAQKGESWQCLLVANRETTLPPLPNRFGAVRVDFPPNPHQDRKKHSLEEVYKSFHHDKGQRVLAGILEAPGSDFVMPVDDDDFVSRRLSTFVEAHANQEGWYVDMGREFVESNGRIWNWPIQNFWQLCGTCNIFRPARISLPQNADFIPNNVVSNMLGAHKYLKPAMEETGHRMLPVPFAAAAYRRGHLNANISGALGRKQLLRLRVFNKDLMRRPSQNLERLASILRSPDAFLSEFAGK